MGAELTIDHTRGEALLPTEADISLVPWLDECTAAAVRAITIAVATQHPEVVAVILFGSVARHEERPLDDDEPSDVDLLMLIEVAPGQTRIPPDQTLALCHTLGETAYRMGDTPREVRTVLAVRDLTDWDPLFIEHVARDGVLLWARGPLPAALAPVVERAATRR